MAGTLRGALKAVAAEVSKKILRSSLARKALSRICSLAGPDAVALFAASVDKAMAVQAVNLLARSKEIDLLLLAYYGMGILKYESSAISGESFVIKAVLRELLSGQEPIFFDVGANVGDFSKELKREFPRARIYAFEPNIHSFNAMHESLARLDIHCVNLGLGSKCDEQSLYIYEGSNTTAHASMYKEVLSDLHHASTVSSVSGKFTTIDGFCQEAGIDSIHFLKIDTEGHEIEVLRGAPGMLAGGHVGILQFEFNEMNIISRVFLRDFYGLLPGYDLYRIDSQRLIPLREYTSRNEIFQFQNILAVNRAVHGRALENWISRRSSQILG